MTKYLFLYRESNYDDADFLDKTLRKASQGFGLAIEEPEWGPMEDRDNYQTWIDTVKDYMKDGQYSFVLFLLDRNDYIYKHLKIHSLVTKGYVSQVVKVSSIKNKKNAMSVCSKILLQINAKLSGVSYMPQLEKNVKDRKLMIIGVDSSHIKGKRTGETGTTAVTGPTWGAGLTGTTGVV